MGFGCRWAGAVAAARRVRVPLVCVGAFGLSACAWGQTGTDGGIAGQVLSSAGTPVEGAVVVARDVETGLAMGVRSGGRGEFLLVRLPAGGYAVTVEDAGVVLTLSGPVEVRLGEVTEVEA